MPSREVNNLLRFPHLKGRVDEMKGFRPREGSVPGQNVETVK
jgi:hypothetical protein